MLLPTLPAPFGAYIRLLRLDRPIGIYLLVWPPLWGLWLAGGGWPGWPLLLVFVFGVIVMRSAGCAINDYADRELDRHVARTRNRPIASGELPPRAGVISFIVLLIIALGLALTLTQRALLLTLPAALLAATYPYAKRWHSGPQLHLGLAFAFSVPIAITATTGEWPPAWGWLTFLGTMAWVVAYDTLYAMADREEDLQVGNRSTAILFGEWDRIAVGVLQGVFLLSMLMVGWMQGFGIPYTICLAGAGVLFVQQLFSVREREAEACLRAFLRNPRVGALIWIGIVLETTDLSGLLS